MDKVGRLIDKNSFLFKLLLNIENHHKNNSHNKIPNLLFNGQSIEYINVVVRIISNILSNNTDYFKSIDESTCFNILVVDCIFNSSIIDIRNIVQLFIKSKFIKYQGHKIIILNNLDELSDEAQCALRVLMEENNTNLFIGITMNINNIVSPILSRMMTIYIDDFIIKDKKDKKYNKNRFVKMKYNKYLYWLCDSKRANIENTVKYFNNIKNELLNIKGVRALNNFFDELQVYIYNNHQTRLNLNKENIVCSENIQPIDNKIESNYTSDYETFVMIRLIKHLCLMKKYEY